MMIITIILAYPPYRRRRQVSRRALTAPPIRRRSRAASRHGRVTARMRARPDDFPSALHPVPINNCVTPRRDRSATSRDRAGTQGGGGVAGRHTTVRVGRARRHPPPPPAGRRRAAADPGHDGGHGRVADVGQAGLPCEKCGERGEAEWLSRGCDQRLISSTYPPHFPTPPQEQQKQKPAPWYSTKGPDPRFQAKVRLPAALSRSPSAPTPLRLECAKATGSKRSARLSSITDLWIIVQSFTWMRMITSQMCR